MPATSKSSARWIAEPPYVDVEFEPASPQSTLPPSNLAQALTSNTSGQSQDPGTLWIKGIRFTVLKRRVFGDCLSAVLLCGLPLLLLQSIRAEPQSATQPLIYTPCAISGIDARPLLFAAVFAVLLILTARRLVPAFKNRIVPRSSVGGNTRDDSANYVDGARAVLGHRRLAMLVIGAGLLICLGLAVVHYWQSPQFALLKAHWSEFSSCKEPDYARAWATMWEAPLASSMYPWLAFTGFGVLFSAALSAYAAKITEWRDLADQRSRHFCNWLRDHTSAHLQWNLLFEQRWGRARPATSSTVGTYEAICHWLRLAFVFAAHEPRKSLSDANWVRQSRSEMSPRTFLRITYAPMIAPLLALLVTPLWLWAIEQKPEKAALLPVAALWVAWCGLYLARISQGLAIRSQYMMISNRMLARLYPTFPVASELTTAVQKFGAPSVDRLVWQLVTVLLAATVGWIGAF